MEIGCKMTSDSKGKKKIHCEGVAIFKLVGYVKNMPDANKFIAKYKVKDNKFYFQLQKMMIWGAEYDK